MKCILSVIHYWDQTKTVLRKSNLIKPILFVDYYILLIFFLFIVPIRVTWNEDRHSYEYQKFKHWIWFDLFPGDFWLVLYIYSICWSNIFRLNILRKSCYIREKLSTALFVYCFYNQLCLEHMMHTFNLLKYVSKAEKLDWLYNIHLYKNS